MITRREAKKMEKIKLGVIVAMDVEMERIEAAMQDAEKQKLSGMIFITGHIAGVPVVAARCGVGKVCAAMCAQRMIDGFAPERILGAGIAGGLKDLKPGQVAIGRDLVQNDFILNVFGYEDGYLPSIGRVHIESDPEMVAGLVRAAEVLGIVYEAGTIASGDTFVNDSEKKRYITETFGAIACEMEGAAIAQVCCMNELPFAVVRCISDSGDENADEDIETNEALSTAGSAAIVLKFIEFYARG